MLIMVKLNTEETVERRHWHMDDGVNCRIFHAQENIGIIYSSSASSATKFGIICKLTGVIQMIWQLLSPMPKAPSSTFFSLRWCSLHVGIFG
uniref:Uncharacterized protein n=1 Tax=Hordeum vulgare subsp. vulgare TaxID=112509 RepID=A0A8I6X814_HORVV